MDQEMKERIKRLASIFPYELSSHRNLFIEHFPEAFEDEKPKPGEVWCEYETFPFVVMGSGKIWFDLTTSLEVGPRDCRLMKLASSLEEYYREKFKNEPKDKSAWVTNMYGREG